jgi:hypothetical protein
MDLYELVWGGLLYGGIAMAITKYVFYFTQELTAPKSYLPWIFEYLAFALCVGYGLKLLAV